MTTGPPRRLRYRYDRVLIDPRHLVGVSSSPLGITADDPFVIATVHPQRTLLRHLLRGDVTVRSVSPQTKYPDEVVRNEIVSLSSCPPPKTEPQSGKPDCNGTFAWWRNPLRGFPRIFREFSLKLGRNRVWSKQATLRIFRSFDTAMHVSENL